MASDPRAWLAEVQERHQPEAWEADAFEHSTSGIGCTGCECGECGNIGDFDGPCPTSAMAAALTAVLGIADAWEAAYREDRVGPGQRIANDLRRAIEKHLTKEDA